MQYTCLREDINSAHQILPKYLPVHADKSVILGVEEFLLKHAQQCLVPSRFVDDNNSVCSPIGFAGRRSR